MEEKKQVSKGIVIGIVAAAVLLVAAIAAMIVIRRMPERKIARLLDLGQQYSADLDYERAIASFDEVLAIEPRNELAVEEEVRAYLAWSEKLASDGEYEQALKVLEEGHEKLEDERLQTALASVKARQEEAEREKQKKKEEEEKQQARQELEEKLNELASEATKLCAEEDYEGVSRLLIENREFIWDGFKKAEMAQYILADQSIGLYEIRDGVFYLYYGDYAGEKREGHGVWIHQFEDGPD
ncbi:MAG: hypothetical protein IJU50_00775, partial [Lachnospiraceae bacterium]|nr:hypothetical protein [Lachnospiraceae bacterium]